MENTIRNICGVCEGHMHSSHVTFQQPVAGVMWRRTDQLFWLVVEESRTVRREIYTSAQHYTLTRDCFGHLAPVPKCFSRQQECRRAHMFNFTVRTSLYVHTAKLMA